MSEAMNLIEEYRALAVQQQQRAERAEATLIAAVLYAAGEDTSILIPNKLLKGVDGHWKLEPRTLKSGLKLTVSLRKDEDAE